MAKRPKKKNAKKPRAVSYELIPRQPAVFSGDQNPMYQLLDTLVVTHHTELLDARIGLAWCTSWKPDVDGRLILGRCKKASDLDRELAEFDFVILLNRKFWFDFLTDDAKRRALLDHELCHATVKFGDDGEPERDARERIVYRMRKHDLEEFSEIVDRHGCYKRDLETFARSLDRARQRTGASWVGYSSVRELLAEAGVTVSLEAVTEWTDAERREAMVWAIVRREVPTANPAVPRHLELLVASQPAPSTEVHA